MRVAMILLGASLLAPPLRGQHLIDRWTGELKADLFGKSVAMLGDVDGDGVCDVAVGSMHPAGSVKERFMYTQVRVHL